MQTAEEAAALVQPQRVHRRFQRFAWGVLAYIVFVVLWGAFVRATGSGAGCGGHWPLCNGDVVPQAPTLATLIEYTHRLTSGLSIAAVVGLWIYSRRVFSPHHRVRRLAAASFVFLLIEALLGAGLVLFDYVAQNASIGRAFYLALHLANTQVLLGVLALAAFLPGCGDRAVRFRSVPSSVFATLPLVVALSMTGAVAALGDTLFPASSVGAGIRQELAGTAHFLLRLRMIHPVLAVATGFCLLWAASSLVRARPSSGTRRAAAALAGLVLAQLAAGAVNIALLAPVWMQLLHLLLADAVWIALLLAVTNAALEPVPQTAR